MAAKRYLAGGVPASGRLNQALGFPVVVKRGDGSRIWTADGVELIDYNLNHGASMLGYNRTEIRAAVEYALDAGLFGSYQTEIDLALARRLVEVIPSAERVRFANTGAEANMIAVRLARAFTGRDLVVKFEGHFHGLHDYLLFNARSRPRRPGRDGRISSIAESAGIPAVIAEKLIVVPWNDPEQFGRAMARYGDRVAAVICEPIHYNAGCIQPLPGYLDLLRDTTQRHGSLLIFDEVLSGFRMTIGGAQAYFRVTPDLTTLGKALGNGLPITALVGRKSVMEHLIPPGKVAHSGTYTGHHLVVSVAQACLGVMGQQGFFDRINQRCDRLCAGLREVFGRAGVQMAVAGLGSTFGLFFGLDEAPSSFAEAMSGDSAQLADFVRRAYWKGLLFHSNGIIPVGHHSFSDAHTEEQIDETLNRLETVATEMGSPVGRSRSK